MKQYILIVGFLLPVWLFSQQLTGTVSNDKGEALAGANVYWLGTETGTFSDSLGRFSIRLQESSPRILIASYIGHITDSLKISNQQRVTFRLQVDNTLGEVLIEDQREGVIISDVNPIKTEQITQTELRKAACCDLAGCFETQTTVQPQTTNVITNSKELRILGLAGVYNQILVDGFPMIQGLSYTYGISSTPGTLVDNIYVSKGANSVLQGYESIVGQINIETKEPDDNERLFLNVYVNNFMEKHFNANYAFKKKKWSNLTAFHTVQPAGKFDRDNDEFLDLPQLRRYMVFNKWSYGKQQDWGWNSKIGIRFLNEQRVGGQRNFDPETDKGSNAVYGQTVQINQPEFWTKTGYRFNDQHNLVFFASGFYQDQNSYFGTVGYDAQQTNIYGNLQYELNYSNHILKTGISYRHLNLREDIVFTHNTLERSYAGNYQRTEHIPGFFAENTMGFFDDKLTWIMGLRADHHNQFGLKTTPRMLVKYDIKPKSILRANIGLGWRTVNLFSENIGLLVSSRDIVFAEQLLPEEALNMGINFTQKFESENESYQDISVPIFTEPISKTKSFPTMIVTHERQLSKTSQGKVSVTASRLSYS